VGHNQSRPPDSGSHVMHLSLWSYLIAIAMGGMSQFVKVTLPDLPWLSSALFWFAVLIALLATLGFAHGKGWLSRVGSSMPGSGLRSSLVQSAMKPPDDGRPRQAAPRAQAPRPAGPAGPVPVLQKRPQDGTGDTSITAGKPGVGSPK
jgi:hypothetical protein